MKPNAIECLDCDVFYEDTEECPVSPSTHGYFPVFISDKPLGRDDDQNYYHYGIKKWVYETEGM